MRPALVLPLMMAALLAGCSNENGAAAPEQVAEDDTPAFYEGRWGADPAWCDDQTDGFPVTITASRWEGYENVCDMTSIADTPEGGWRAEMTCLAEGMESTETLILAPAGDQLAITWLDRDAETTLFTRCQ